MTNERIEGEADSGATCRLWTGRLRSAVRARRGDSRRGDARQWRTHGARAAVGQVRARAERERRARRGAALHGRQRAAAAREPERRGHQGFREILRWNVPSHRPRSEVPDCGGGSSFARVGAPADVIDGRHQGSRQRRDGSLEQSRAVRGAQERRAVEARSLRVLLHPPRGEVSAMNATHKNGGKRIRVGIIGANADGGWASQAHIPALKSLSDDFEITALSTTRRESAAAASKLFEVSLAFDNHQELLNSSAVDVVAVTVKVPH